MKSTPLMRRLQSPTPRFFKRLRNYGLLLTAISAVLTAAPIALPAILIKIAGYAAVAGGIASAVCQATTADSQPGDER